MKAVQSNPKERQEILDVYDQAEHLWRDYCTKHEVQCPAGCDTCCRQFFPLWPGEVGIVKEGLSQLSESVLQSLKPEAERQFAMQREMYAKAGMPSTPALLMMLPEPMRNELIVTYLSMLSQVSEPCLLLNNGCLIYPHRPLMCRLYGYPVRTQMKNLCETLLEPYITAHKAFTVVEPSVFDPLTGAPHRISLRYRPNNPYNFSTVAEVVCDLLRGERAAISGVD